MSCIVIEVRGWRKTGRPKQLNPSFTELKTVRCIIYGPGLVIMLINISIVDMNRQNVLT